MSILVPSEAARFVRMPVGRLLRLARLGKCPCILLPDHVVRFDEVELSQWIEAHRVRYCDDGARATGEVQQ